MNPRAAKSGRNPFRVERGSAPQSQGSSFLATLGFEAESLWDSQVEEVYAVNSTLA
jgi:hypothetical protein